MIEDYVTDKSRIVKILVGRIQSSIEWQIELIAQHTLWFGGIVVDMLVVLVRVTTFRAAEDFWAKVTFVVGYHATALRTARSLSIIPCDFICVS